MNGKRIARVATTAIAALALGGGVAACGEDDDGGGGGSGGGGQGKAAKIALLLPETKTARYESQDRPNFERKVKELCSNCTIEYANAATIVASCQSDSSSFAMWRNSDARRN